MNTMFTTDNQAIPKTQDISSQSNINNFPLEFYEKNLSFCQCDPLMSESFWQKNRHVTLFDLRLFKHFSPVANFDQQSLQPLKAFDSIVYQYKGT